MVIAERGIRFGAEIPQHGGELRQHEHQEEQQHASAASSTKAG